MTVFSDASHTSAYAERTARIVPGLQALHRMALVLLTEKSPVDARVLVLGAGGGLELKAFAELQPGWTFEGVDPSADMLALARTTLGALATRVHWHEGYIDTTDQGPFDAGACLLTLHFLPSEERLRTLRQLRQRLRPGAPLVVAHHSFAHAGGDKEAWLCRNAALAIANGVPPEQAEGSIAAMKERLPILSPQEDEALLRAAGFSGVEMFYAAFTFRGWVAYA